MVNKALEHILVLSQILLGIACVCLIIFYLSEADRKNVSERVARNMCGVTEGHLVKELGDRGHYFCYTRNKDGKTFNRTVLLTGES
jgi:hypothetical protein